MAVTHKTVFKIFENHPSNACFHLYGHKFTESYIKVGVKTFTIETIVHEIAELETVKVLMRLRKTEKLKEFNPIITLDNGFYSNRLAHFLAPHGENSILNPYVSELYEDSLL